MPTNTEAQLRALKLISAAIIEAVKAAGPMGAPGGILYAALMTHGCTMGQFEIIMDTLVKVGMLQKKGDCYFLGEKFK